MSKTKIFFIAGTDTDIGKTTATVALINHIQNNNFTALGLKPLAAGPSDDALLLQHASNLKPEFDHVNPYRFSQAASPHIINNIVNNTVITAEDIKKNCLNNINIYNPDYCFIEGAGGWLCPLNEQETFEDIAIKLNIPVILIVGIKLGCLNHAMLTIDRINNKKLKLHGWVANCIDNNFSHKQENINYLKNRISAPYIGTIDYIIKSNIGVQPAFML